MSTTCPELCCWRTSTRSRWTCSVGRVEVESLAGALDEAELIEALDGVAPARHPLEDARDRRGARAPRRTCVAIGAFCIGTNQIDLAAAAARGVAVFNAPFSNTRSVVELAIAEIISLTRRLTERDRALHDGVWDKSATGATRSAAARSASSATATSAPSCPCSPRTSACRVSSTTPPRSSRWATRGAATPSTSCSRRADIVTLHVDGRARQRRAVRRRAVRADEAGAACFLNLSRGFVVDYAALRDAIASAATSPAPPSTSSPRSPSAGRRRSSSELRGLPNVILTPHIGGSTEEAQEAIGQFVADKLRDYVAHRVDDAERQPARPRARAAPGAHRIAHCTATCPACWPPSTRCRRARRQHRGPAAGHPRRARLRGHRRERRTPGGAAGRAGALPETVRLTTFPLAQPELRPASPPARLAAARSTRGTVGTCRPRHRRPCAAPRARRGAPSAGLSAVFSASTAPRQRGS